MHTDQQVIAALLVCLEKFSELKTEGCLSSSHLDNKFSDTRHCIRLANLVLEMSADQRSLNFGVIERLLQQVEQNALCLPTADRIHENKACLAWWLMKCELVRRVNRYLWASNAERIEILDGQQNLLERELGIELDSRCHSS